MKLRTLGKTGLQVAPLGFGAMRLPTRGSEAEVDEPLTAAMLREAIDQGVNYVDTAYVYHGGNGETAIGKALSGGYRQRVLLATKLPIWAVNDLSDCERIFAEQLRRLQTDRIDLYLLHCLQKRFWDKARGLGVPEWMERLRAQGRIGHIGFSFHDAYETLVEIIDAHDWGFCQIQYNYVNERVQAGTPGLKYAFGAGLGVIVMEPLFGGALADPPPAIRALWNAAETRRSPVDLALSWLWDKPEVSLVLSGMSALEQVRENIEIARRADVGALSKAELELVARARQAYDALATTPCTKCGYCQPCPQGVNIPFNIELYNNALVFFGRPAVLSRNLYHMLPETERAAACANCGQCVDRCPQQIAIPETLRRVAAKFL